MNALNMMQDAYDCYHDIPDEELTTDGRAFKRWVLTLEQYLKEANPMKGDDSNVQSGILPASGHSEVE